ncbi:ribosomal-protein-alanine acetyltransferase [Fulvivirga imtechensis AK7]|uniref:Ribosomal-protein-alanine acetyltransferase n=2 Tax=Fulvivirga TaxID=396811 RepID=L8JML2_9BACT|nr:ribosomal-protein-alanine acetyltransferase [Fulvivirga imtechensis AK7]
MMELDAKLLSGELTEPSADMEIFIAEDAESVPLGFLHIRLGSDHYNSERHAHISDIVVAPEGEGQGIARLLIERGEEWARSQGFRWVTLNVFSQNVHARAVYKRLGFGEDIIKCFKELN